MEWKEAKDIKKDLLEITSKLNLSHINSRRIFCYRSYGSKSRAHARIWAIPKIFQDALSIEPAYVIEVLSEHYDKYDDDFKKRVLIHELLHIPKNFSGALLSHKGKGRHLDKLANELFIKYKNFEK